MKKIICDRCGKEMIENIISPTHHIDVYFYDLSSGSRGSYDLCPKCKRELKDFLNKHTIELQTRIEEVKDSESNK